MSERLNPSNEQDWEESLPQEERGLAKELILTARDYTIAGIPAAIAVGVAVIAVAEKLGIDAPPHLVAAITAPGSSYLAATSFREIVERN